MLNEAFLVGYVSADPIVTQSRDGRPVTMVVLKIQNRYRDSAGNQKQSEDSVKVVFLNSLAEAADSAIEQGMEIYVKGRVQAEDRVDFETGRRFKTLNVVGYQFHITRYNTNRRQYMPESDSSEVKSNTMDVVYSNKSRFRNESG